MESSDFQSDFSARLHKDIIIKPKPVVIRRTTGVDKRGCAKVPDVKPIKVSHQEGKFVGAHSDQELPGRKLAIKITGPTKISREASRFVSGTKAKVAILRAYQEKHGSAHQHPITTQPSNRGTSPNPSFQLQSQRVLVKACKMKPDQNKYYNAKVLKFENIITLLLAGFMDVLDVMSLSRVSKFMNKVVPEIVRLLNVDWRPLTRPRLNYKNQQQIDPHRVDMATALAIRAGLDPGKIVRTLNGEYTGAHRNVGKILRTVAPVVSVEDYDQIKRILTKGCPFSLKFEEEGDKKMRAISRGNQKSFIQNPDVVQETLNKEDRNSHLVPMHDWVCRLGSNMRHTPQGLVINRVVWDGTTKIESDDVVMNEVSRSEGEPEVTFGMAKVLFYQYVYNLRVSFPDEPIFLALADVKACFRYPRIHPDLTGAFGFLAGKCFCLATAMVFGHISSSPSWEPFRRAIENLSVSFANRADLVEKHKRFLDMISWEVPLEAAEKPVRAASCELNPGVLDASGNQIPHPAHIWVDDAMMAAMGIMQMKMVLAAVIESIFAVMGEPAEEVRQCHLAMDKWKTLIVAEHQLALGLNINTRRLVVAITKEYKTDTLKLIQTHWHKERKRFKAIEASKLTGKLTRLAEGAPWVHHMVSHLFTSIALALAQNKEFLRSASSQFKSLLETIKAKNFKSGMNSEHNSIVRFAIKKQQR